MQIQNPILRGFNPDPCLCRKGEDYYIATSTFEWFPGVQIHHSRDLKNWQLISHPLNRLSQLNMHGNPDSGGVWAPALSYADGKFWLVYSDVKIVTGAWKDGHNYLVTCDTIDGEWSEPVYLNSAGFDPSLYHDEESGKKYVLNMVWDRRVDNHSFYGISIQEYSHDQQKLMGERQIIFKGSEAKLTEAPHIYKVGEYYYLLTAEGGTTYAHIATIARSKSLMGPYEIHPENPLITAKHDPKNPLQKAGHASMLYTHTDEWYLAYLMGRPIMGDGNSALAEGRNTAVNQTQLDLMNRGYCPLGRETAIAKLEWSAGWPYVVGGNSPSVFVEAPQVAEVPMKPTWPVIDHFDNNQLNINFQTLRIPLPAEILTLTERPGHLRLYGRESLLSRFTQATIARRWQSLNFIAETVVEFNPTTFQQMAGLTCYYNTTNWTIAYISHDETKGRIIELMTAENGRYAQPIAGNEIVIPTDVTRVYFRVTVQVENYTYHYSFDGETWYEIPVKLESYKLADDFVAGGGFFTGAFVGLHCNDGSGANIYADFDYFRYEEF